MGASANLITTPYGALIVGTVAGAVSTLGYVYLTVSFLPFNFFNTHFRSSICNIG